MPGKHPVSSAARGILRQLKKAAALKLYVNDIWQQREKSQEWENVQRLNLFLAKRRILGATGDLATVTTVRVGFPFLGPAATPENVVAELRKMDHALRTGDFDRVGFGPDDETYVCVNGHDRCSTSTPGPDCPYCERED